MKLALPLAAALVTAAAAVPFLSDAGTTHHHAKKTAEVVSCASSSWAQGNASSRSTSTPNAPAPATSTNCTATAHTYTGTDAATPAAANTAPLNSGQTGDFSGATGNVTQDATNTDSVAGIRSDSSKSQ